jgi:hypothetical protein
VIRSPFQAAFTIGVVRGCSESAGMDNSALHALYAPTKAAPIYRKTGNRRAVQLRLEHTKIESTVRTSGSRSTHSLSLSGQVEL